MLPDCIVVNCQETGCFNEGNQLLASKANLQDRHTVAALECRVDQRLKEKKNKGDAEIVSFLYKIFDLIS